MQPLVGIIGAGKVGRTLARLWHRAGFRIAAVYSRTYASAEKLAERIDAHAVDSVLDVVRMSDLTLLSVPDDAIEAVAQSILEADWSDKGVIHASGATDFRILDLLADRGAMIGSLHPAFPFADVDTAVNTLPGATFAIESSHTRLREWLISLITVLDGKHIDIPPGGKAQYHAALCIASNYLVTLYAVAESLLKDLGAEQASISNALNTSVSGTVENLVNTGIPWALTGPLSRGDTGTIEKHLLALDGQAVVKDVYIGLARLTYPMLEARGLPEYVTTEFETLFNQD